jgi:hypothetical protein
MRYLLYWIILSLCLWLAIGWLIHKGVDQFRSMSYDNSRRESIDFQINSMTAESDINFSYGCAPLSKEGVAR